MSNSYNEQVIKATIAQIGPQGIPGEAATIAVGSVTTGAAGSYASVTNSGDSTNAVFDFVIPRGDKGATGAQGPQGIQGIQGETGNGISSIEKISTAGMVDTYRINLTNNTHYDFSVTNGAYISSIDKTSTSGLVDTYTITLTNGNTQTFTVTNGAKGDKGETGDVGNGILNILKMSTEGLVDNYRINFTNGTYFDYTVTNAKSITGISKTGSSGLVDTYKITFNDNTSFSFPVTNGNGVAGVTLLSWVGLDKTYRMTFTNGTYFDYIVSNGAAGQAEWGGISGVISNQADLQQSFHALKSYKDAGELLTDSEGLADVIKYAHNNYNSTPFTPTGSPTNVDGLASGFTTSDYYSVSLTTSISTSDTFEFDMKFTTPASFGGTQTIWAIGNNYRAYQGGSGYLYCLFWGQSTGFQMTASTTYQVKFIYDGSNIYAKYKKDTDTTWSTTNTTAISSGTTQTNPTITIGSQGSSNAFNGSIDLKYFAVKVNGSLVVSGNVTGIDTINLVYQPCLKIPYTLSKTGSKIVDAVYRDRVNDMAEQFGYANYYTLDEINGNFTLPQGELYGMIEGKLDNSTPHIVDVHINGTEGYIIYSNKWCKQWGVVPTGTAMEQSYQIDFYKTMADTNYMRNIQVFGASSVSIYDSRYNTAWSLTTTSMNIIRTNVATIQQSWWVEGFIA